VPGFTFNGWNPTLNLNNVTSNRTFTAQWTPVVSPPTSPQQPQPPPQQWWSQQTWPTGGGGNDNDRSSNISQILSAFTPTSTIIEHRLAATEVATLPRAADGTVRSRHGGQFVVLAATWAQFGFAYTHDTTDRDGVQVRVSINDPRAMTGDVLVSAWVTGTDVNRVRNLFERFFSNDVRVVRFDHTAEWGQTVRVAARVDLTGMDVEGLYFYSYDSAANTFRLIVEPNYRIDANGFLWFNTDRGGSVIVSDGTLAQR